MRNQASPWVRMALVGIVAAWAWPTYRCLAESASSAPSSLPAVGSAASTPADDPALQGHYLIAQSDLTGCGGIALSVLARLQGKKWARADVASALAADEQGGTTVEQLCQTAGKLGMPLKTVAGKIETLSSLTPCIVHLKEQEKIPAHFCVVAAVRSDSVLMINPPEATQWIPRQRFEPIWDGIALTPTSFTTASTETSYWWYGITGGGSFLAGAVLWLLIRKVL